MADPGGTETVARRYALSVRVRILAAVLVTTTLGMLGAGSASYIIARQHAYDSVHSDLVQESEEINTVVRMIDSGQAGRPVKGPGDVLYLAIKSSVPDPGGAIIGLVDGRIAWVPDSDEPTQKSAQDDAELIAAAAAIQPGSPVEVRELRTTGHSRLAFISIPVQVDGSAQLGHFVAAVDVAEVLQPVARSHLTYALACLVALLAIGVVGYQVAGRLLSPLRSLQATAQRISETDLTDRIPDDQLAGRDEVADLGRTMNAMLDRLSSSFDHQRRLLDDAGHELRTPITIVRGHLELLDPDDPADVKETRAVSLDELDRMQRLVDDLMTLAKSQRPDFVRPEPVEVDQLLSSVRGLVAPLADRQWQIEASTAAVVALDRQRITQALVQLVANAVRFTAPRAVIALGGSVGPDGRELRLWVRDTGTGITAEDRERIFERFGRGHRSGHGSPEETVRLPEHDGAGLGLAIVAAIAEAHHGRIELDSTPGLGSTFTLCLPLDRPSTTTRSEDRARHRHR